MSDSMEPAAAAVRALLGRLGDADEGLAEYLATCIATSVEEEDDQGCQREVGSPVDRPVSSVGP
jgi:hypothetical protein